MAGGHPAMRKPGRWCQVFCLPSGCSSPGSLWNVAAGSGEMPVEGLGLIGVWLTCRFPLRIVP